MEDRIIKAYNKGFKDEINGSSSEEYTTAIENSAYSLGVLHVLMGDTIPFTNKEVLKTLNENYGSKES
jgi:ribosome modulation factor